MLRSLTFLLVLVACIGNAHSQVSDARVDVGPFSSSGLKGWERESFAGETGYRLVVERGRTVLQADSKGSASALYYPLRVDLTKTPILNWSWRKLSTLDPGDESSKSGDDFVARVYVIQKRGLLFWKTRAINYVWSYQHRQGEVWNNPFAGSNARMVAQRDALHGEEDWFTEQRNVAEDFRQLFGESVQFIDGVAIMTDTDNSASRASAQYGDIYFSAPPAVSFDKAQ